MSLNKANNNLQFSIKNIESSNLFQRRIHHVEPNYDFIGGDDTHESNTNTQKNSTDKNDNLKLNNTRELSSPGVGSGEKNRSSSKMESQMGKSVKFEVNKGSVNHLIKLLSES